MATQGYRFYIGEILLPLTPSSVKIKIGDKNKTVDMANGGDMTILKSPALTTISFDATFPNDTNLPFLMGGKGEVKKPEYYLEYLKELKQDKRVFQFIITRTKPNGMATFDTNFTCVLSSFTLSEEANNGLDLSVRIELKQYVHYKTKIYNPNSSSTDSRNEKQVTFKNYIVVDGDTLWSIAKRHFGDGSKWTVVYNDNKSVIESTAKKRGLASSRNGHWIFPGTVLSLRKG